MPRGRRKVIPKTIPEQIAEVDAQMLELENKKSELKARRKELLDMQEKQDIEQFIAAAKAENKTPAEYIAELKALIPQKQAE